MSDDMPEWGKRLLKDYRIAAEEEEALKQQGKFRCYTCREIKSQSEHSGGGYCDSCYRRKQMDNGGFYHNHPRSGF